MNVAIDITSLNWKFTGVQRYICEVISNLNLHKEIEAPKIFYYKRIWHEDYLHLKKNLGYIKKNPRRLIQIIDPKIVYSSVPSGKKKIFEYLRCEDTIQHAISIYNSRVAPLSISCLDEIFYKKIFKNTDIVYLPFPVSKQVLMRLWNIFYKRPKIVTIYDLSPFLFKDFFDKDTAHKFRQDIEETAKKVDRIITISEATKRDLIAILNVPENKISVIYPGVGMQFRPIEEIECRKKIRIIGLDYRNYFLCLFTIEPRKNLGVVLKAYDMMERVSKNGAKLVIVGEKGWKLDKALHRYGEYLKNPNIIFTGFIKEALLPYIINGAISLVCPSFYEGFGFPLVEAMKCGVPVICSNTSCFPEVVGDSAIMIDPCDVGALTHFMLEIANNSNLRKELSEKGLERAKKFDWKETTRRIVEVYKSVIS